MLEYYIFLFKFHWSLTECQKHKDLTILVLILEYSGWNLSMLWVLMACHLVSPWHHQAYYWQWRTHLYLSSTRKDFHNLRHLTFEKWYRNWYLYIAPSKFSATRVKRLGPLLSKWSTFNPAWINNHMPSKVWNEITYPFPNLIDCTISLFGMDTSFRSTFYNGCN